MITIVPEFQVGTMYSVVLKLTHIIESVVTGQAPVTLDQQNTEEK